MKKLLLVLLLVPLLLAAKPVRTVISEADGYVTVDVSAEKGNFNPYSVWVAVICEDSVDHEPVVYDEDGVGTAGPFTFDGTCIVYAWEFPSPGDPISNTLER